MVGRPFKYLRSRFLVHLLNIVLISESGQLETLLSFRLSVHSELDRKLNYLAEAQAHLFHVLNKLLCL